MDQRITVTEQGPYLVAGSVPLRRMRAVRSPLGAPVAWEAGPPLETGDTYALCRCGGSSRKPFCDGTHATRDWDGTCTAPAGSYDERATSYPGPGLVLRDDRALCAHAGFCATTVTNAWKMTKHTDDPAVRAELTAMVARCPSGALTYRAVTAGTDAQSDVEPDLAPGIRVIDDGPLQVTGAVTVLRADGVPLETRPRMTLCRCGASSTKPLCDGSHARAGFADAQSQTSPPGGQYQTSPPGGQ